MTRPGHSTPRATQYEEEPRQIENREARNKARADAKKAGKSIVGKDVAHIKPLAGGGSNIRSNERVEAIARNRGWRKGQRGYHVPEDK